MNAGERDTGEGYASGFINSVCHAARAQAFEECAAICSRVENAYRARYRHKVGDKHFEPDTIDCARGAERCLNEIRAAAKLGGGT